VAAPLAAQPFNLRWISDRHLHMTAHLVVWGLLALLLAAGLGRWIWLAWPLGLLLAAAEELHQGLVPGRTVDFDDWLLNAAAITIAVLLLRLLRPGRRPRPFAHHV
jgi:VanZ family protein